MTIGEVIINRVAKKTVICKTREDAENCFNGVGYPYSFGFSRAENNTHWKNAFIDDSKNFEYDQAEDIRVVNPDQFHCYTDALLKKCVIRGCA